MSKWREIKKFGGSYVILLAPIDMIDLNLELEDLVDIENIQKKDMKGGNK